MVHRVTTRDDEWQRVTTNDNERYSKWKRVITSSTTSDNDSSTANDNEWQQMTTRNNEWQRVTANDNEWHNKWQRKAHRKKANESEWEWF